MVDKKQLNVRIPVELYNQITDSGESKAHIVIEAIKLYFNNNSYKSDSKTVESLLKQLEEKDIQIAAKDRQISEVHILLQNAMSQRAIEAPDYKRKPWWRFWD
jgi:flagellar motor switch protein FliG